MDYLRIIQSRVLGIKEIELARWVNYFLQMPLAQSKGVALSDTIQGNTQKAAWSYVNRRIKNS
jgi:hypothetical protein